MQDKGAVGLELSEESVVAKVAELLETLDHVKKYNAFAHSFKKFVLIVLGSILVFLAIGASIGFLNLAANLDRPQLFFGSVLLLFVPIGGILAGVFYIRKNVNSIKVGVWKDELSLGFPFALKILLGIDWDETFDEISSGRISYAFYGLIKVAAYWVVSLFAFSLVGNITSFVLFHQSGFFGPFFVLFSFLFVFLLLKNDFSKRYNEIRALDNLLWELRWFSVELRRVEFQT